MHVCLKIPPIAQMPSTSGRWGLSSQESWAAICVASVCDTSGSHGRTLAAQKACAAGEKKGYRRELSVA